MAALALSLRNLGMLGGGSAAVNGTPRILAARALARRRGEAAWRRSCARRRGSAPAFAQERTNRLRDHSSSRPRSYAPIPDRNLLHERRVPVPLHAVAPAEDVDERSEADRARVVLGKREPAREPRRSVHDRDHVTRRGVRCRKTPACHDAIAGDLRRRVLKRGREVVAAHLHEPGRWLTRGTRERGRLARRGGRRS